MPDFKIVVSDPRAKELRIVPVKVVGVPNLEYSEKHKEQRELVIGKANPKLIELLNPELGVVIIRIWKNRANNEKVKIAAKIVPDSSLEIQVIAVPEALLREKIGAGEAIGEVFRAPAFQIRISGGEASRLIGMRIGDRIDGSVIGFPNIVLEIRGGSDLAGFPMRKDISGAVKKYVLLSSGPGYRPKEEGERRRKLVRGNTISEDIVQINTVAIFKSVK
ncbi:30S ribosomal protein S6e [Ignisphaera sp. 4213-co]|uniref:Small ribosomal subunit protein eS6 n=1 Tax=Ignisphaera cupida TaxID=3050454 RepID=A0ABD4Z5J0_9CREN|nr:30S ribosomal protein S6e [Ignisphaera sp. 4213-co]MDK6028566.1 30S ribosomal protein S6e [Ignisphaera sp. 4213-co]